MTQPLPVISVWQPFASLLITGFKGFETKGYPPPEKYIGQRIGIAATKQVKKEQIEAAKDRALRRHINAKDINWGHFALEDYPLGCILGTAKLNFAYEITPKVIRAIPARERAFGWWRPGRWAWAFVDHDIFDQPIHTRGGQGIWHYHGEIPKTAKR